MRVEAVSRRFVQVPRPPKIGADFFELLLLGQRGPSWRFSSTGSLTFLQSSS
jgi:hypothetical protein